MSASYLGSDHAVPGQLFDFRGVDGEFGGLHPWRLTEGGAEGVPVPVVLDADDDPAVPPPVGVDVGAAVGVLGCGPGAPVAGAAQQVSVGGVLDDLLGGQVQDP